MSIMNFPRYQDFDLPTREDIEDDRMLYIMEGEDDPLQTPYAPVVSITSLWQH